MNSRLSPMLCLRKNMIAILTVFYECAGSQLECHSNIDAEFNLEDDEISQDAHHTFLENHGWLYLNDTAYCPVCRFELHD